MAINPNSTFVTGAVYTADQANRFPFGIVALTTKTTDTAITTTEAVTMTASFTAIANRYYRITYFEGDLFNANGSTDQGSIAKIRAGSTTSGTELQFARVNLLPQGESCLITSVLTTFTAGSQTVVGTLVVTAGTGTALHSATRPGQLIVEDMGPA